MIKFNTSVCNFHNRILRIMKICCFIDNLSYTLCTCCAHGDHNKYHGKHHKAHKNIHTICKKTHQFTCSQTAANDHIRTQPADSKNTCIYCKLHNRHIHNYQFLSSYKHFVNFIAGFLKLSGLIFFTYISLHNADCADILLHAGI